MWLQFGDEDAKNLLREVSAVVSALPVGEITVFYFLNPSKHADTNSVYNSPSCSNGSTVHADARSYPALLDC